MSSTDRKGIVLGYIMYIHLKYKIYSRENSRVSGEG